VRRRGSHIFQTVSSQMAMKLLALSACRPPFTPKKIPGSHLCYRLSRTQVHSAAGRIRSNDKSNSLIGSQTRDLPACSIAPQPTTLKCAIKGLSNRRAIHNPRFPLLSNNSVPVNPSLGPSQSLYVSFLACKVLPLTTNNTYSPHTLVQEIERISEGRNINSISQQCPSLLPQTRCVQIQKSHPLSIRATISVVSLSTSG
jgi:hypothetical protein